MIGIELKRFYFNNWFNKLYRFMYLQNNKIFLINFRQHSKNWVNLINEIRRQRKLVIWSLLWRSNIQWKKIFKKNPSPTINLNRRKQISMTKINKMNTILTINFEKNLLFSKDLGFHWHKSWKLPNINVKMEILNK